MRNDVLSWDQYFMGMAHLSAKRSKDPNTRVGKCRSYSRFKKDHSVG